MPACGAGGNVDLERISPCSDFLPAEQALSRSSAFSGSNRRFAPSGRSREGGGGMFLDDARRSGSSRPANKPVARLGEIADEREGVR